MSLLDTQIIKIENHLSSKYEKIGIIKVSENEVFNVSEQYNYFSVNLVLSELLIDQKKDDWDLISYEFVRNKVVGSNEKIIVVDNFELLMSSEIKLNIFELFKNLSKNKIIIIIWRYHMEDNFLIYGEYGHSEYQRININNILILGEENNEI